MARDVKGSCYSDIWAAGGERPVAQQTTLYKGKDEVCTLNCSLKLLNALLQEIDFDTYNDNFGVIYIWDSNEQTFVDSYVAVTAFDKWILKR